jgi:hypothetical protein
MEEGSRPDKIAEAAFAQAVPRALFRERWRRVPADGQLLDAAERAPMESDSQVGLAHARDFHHDSHDSAGRVVVHVGAQVEDTCALFGWACDLGVWGDGRGEVSVEG